MLQTEPRPVDAPTVHLAVRTALTAALATALTTLLAAPASAASAAPDVEALQAALAAATTQTTSLAQDLTRQAAGDGQLRVSLQRLARAQQQAQARLDARVRTAWMHRAPTSLSGWTALDAAGTQRLATRGVAAAVQVDRDLLDAVADRTAAATRLRTQVATLRDGLADQAAAALTAQDHARDLLAQAQAAVAAEQAARADARRLAEQSARLAAARAALDAASAATTTALTPAQTTRSRRSAEREAPVLTRIEAAGSGYPAGFAPSGQVLAGLASWYGPGFVGSPTASGAPYDPERLTCAHKTLPLGTVLRVSANGRAVSCLVNDRGPYVGPRILDLSRAGSRALGYDGVAQVVIEVLTPI